MFLSLLAMETTELVSLISIIALAVLGILLVVLCVANKKSDTRSLVYAAICISTGFALSFIKFSPVTYGGSITLASFLPLLIYAYAYGPVKGLLAGLIYGVLQFVQEPYILTPMTFVLDYLLAFASIALMGFAPKFSKSVMANVLLGCVLVYVFRFIVHLVSGIIYFNLGEIYTDLPQSSAFLYSFLYQCCYLPGDCVICMVVLFLFVRQNVFSRLISLMAQKRTPVAVQTDEEKAQQEQTSAQTAGEAGTQAHPKE